jgi:hypothetical protein
MRQKSVHPESPSERLVKNIRRVTRKRHSAEEKIRIVLDGLRGESSVKSHPTPTPHFASNIGSDSLPMKFTGELAVLQMGNQRHADWTWNFVPCTEWVGCQERK